MRMTVLADAESVAREGAAFIAAAARAAVGPRGRFVMAVSGGQTPWRMLRALAGETVPYGFSGEESALRQDEFQRHRVAGRDAHVAGTMTSSPGPTPGARCRAAVPEFTATPGGRPRRAPTSASSAPTSAPCARLPRRSTRPTACTSAAVIQGRECGIVLVNWSIGRFVNAVPRQDRRSNSLDWTFLLIDALTHRRIALEHRISPTPHERSPRQSTHVRFWWGVWYAPPELGVWRARDGSPAVLRRSMPGGEKPQAPHGGDPRKPWRAAESFSDSRRDREAARPAWWWGRSLPMT